MKKKSFLLLSSILLVFFEIYSEFSFADVMIQDPGNLPESSYHLSHFISLQEAENLLGCQAHIKDSLLKHSGGYIRFQFTYKANCIDSITSQTNSLFFGFEQY